MADVNLQLKTLGAVWVGWDLYIDRSEAVEPALNELRAIGYTVESLREDEHRHEEGTTVEQMEKGGWSLWYCRLTDIRRGKCSTCQAYISEQGIRSQGHTCENCGAITYLEIQDGSLVRFNFVGEEGYFPSELQMKAYYWDADQSDLYLYPDFPEQRGGWGVLHGDKTQEYLAKHQDKWERVERDGNTYLKVRYVKSSWTKDHEGVSTIDVRDISNHYWGHKIVRLWEGKEYSEWDTKFPVPESISVLEAWHWAPLHPSPTLHEKIIHAAGMVSDQGYYYQDGRAAFYAVHWERMRVFVEHFTALDINEWDRARFRHDGPGAIADIARFCSPSAQVANRPNFGNSIVAHGKALEGNKLTDQELNAAADGLRDPHRPRFD